MTDTARKAREAEELTDTGSLLIKVYNLGINNHESPIVYHVHL